MRFAILLTAAVASAMALSAQGFAQQKAEASPSAPLATPAGATLKTVRIGQGVNVPGSSSNQPRERLIFANDKNQALYFSEKDAPGQSACDAACAKEWPPFTAPPGARSVGDWSLIARDDGAMQWAFRGKALYSSVKDVRGAGASGHDVDGHRILEIVPAAWMTLPAGITVAEVLTAPGQVLTNAKGMSLYTFDGDPNKDKAIAEKWAPFAAPQVALPTGDFTVIGRDDGRFQWAYRGKALYTFKGDLELGDSNGKDIDKRFHVATVMRYFMPQEVAIKKDERRGGLLVTAADGKALYARDRASYGGTGGHNSRGGARGNPATGQAIGLSGCDAACEKTWLPLGAPNDAQPSGYWSVFVRGDGSKQWGYQGYALYTYANEKPGEVTGHDIYSLVVNHDTQNIAPANMGLGLYWRVTAP